MKAKCILVLIISALIFLSTGTSVCQDPNYSQFFNTPNYYNPAYTGLYNGLRVRFEFRDQWPSLPVDFKSYHFSADLGDRNLPGAGGLSLLFNTNNEGIGLIQDLEVGLGVSVRVQFAENILGQIGIKTSYMQKSLNWDDFVYTKQLDAIYGYSSTVIVPPPGIDKRAFIDFGIGGVMQFTTNENRFFSNVGVAIDHLFQPEESFIPNEDSRLPRKWVIHNDWVIASNGSIPRLAPNEFSGPLTYNPGIIYQIQGTSQSVELGLNLQKFNIYLGTWYKSTFGSNSSKAVVLLAGYRYVFQEGMFLKFCYSYDLQITGALSSMGGAHEISLILTFDNLSVFGAAKSPRKINRIKKSQGCTEF